MSSASIPKHYSMFSSSWR